MATSPQKRILLTGGMGFIGSWLVRHLLATRPDVIITNLDLLEYAGNPDNLKDMENHPNYRFVQGDIRDEGLVGDLMTETDIVINAAAANNTVRKDYRQGFGLLLPPVP